MILLLKTYICSQSASEEKILTENKDLCGLRCSGSRWMKLALADESSLVAEERRFSANLIRKRCKKKGLCC
jgi:hypothetical protein